MQPVRYFFLFFFASLSFSQELPKNLTLDKVEYRGSTLFTPAELNGVAGLKPGAPVQISDLNKATKLLTEWGYFKFVQYEFSYRGAQLSAVFKLQEHDQLAACYFDNFIGFEDQALDALIKKKYPSFKGILPIEGTVLQTMSSILENAIKEKGAAHSVISFPVFSEKNGMSQYITFAIENFNPLICRIAIEGDDPALQPLLQKATQGLSGSTFSRPSVERYFTMRVASRVKNLGYWNFDLSEINAENTPDCANGILLKLVYKAGQKQVWNAAIWSGNSNISSEQLNGFLGMQPGEIAGLEKIEAGLIKIAQAYSKIGFVEYTIRGVKPSITPRGLDYMVQISEGDRYAMGTFEKLTYDFPVPIEQLIQNWKLRSGDIFDGAYFDEFKEKQFKPWKEAYAKNSNLDLKLFPDIKQRTVNIRLFPELPPQVKPPNPQ